MEHTIKELSRQIKRLEEERIDLHTYLATSVQASTDDLGPAYEEPMNDTNQHRMERITAITEEINRLRHDLENIEQV